MADLQLVGQEVRADEWGGEHPIDVARRALIAASRLELPLLAGALLLAAQSLPIRRPIVKGGGMACPDWTPNVPDTPEAVEEFLPVVIENDREIGRRDRVNVCSTYEQAVETAAEQAARMRTTEPTARAAVLRRRVGPWEVV